MPIDDDNVFRYFAHDPPVKIPEGFSAELDIRTASEIQAERMAWLEKTETCEACKGHGRVLKS